jgi:cell division protein FtsI (penicillin-binding protein 3)
MLKQNECEYGTCIVMEVSTGKIKAMANLGKRPGGGYWEDLNYAIRASEPGSTFKLATLLSLLEDKYTALDHHVNIEGGKWEVNGRTVYDAEEIGLYDVTVKQAFEHSSNVGMAKLAMSYYYKNPLQYIGHLKKLHLNQYTGIDLVGETSPVIKTPQSKTWSATTLPWMAFGYEVLVSPLQTLMLYNAVANDGKMMKPWLVNAVEENGIVVRENKPVVIDNAICSPETLKKLQECLEGVCKDSLGTARILFKGSLYKVAGKTGTALMANGSHGYAENIHQSAFVGYFPANHPQYSCIVVIRNKPNAKIYYGALIAGPVFKEIADKLYALHPEDDNAAIAYSTRENTSAYFYTGASNDLKTVMQKLNWNYTDSSGRNEWARLYAVNDKSVLNSRQYSEKNMPDLRGMGLRNALSLLESMNIKVITHGRGKVNYQSIGPGTTVNKNETVTIELN